MQKVQGNFANERSIGNPHNSRSHVEVSEVWNSLRAEESLGKTLQSLSYGQMHNVSTGEASSVSFNTLIILRRFWRAPEEDEEEEEVDKKEGEEKKICEWRGG